MEIDDTADGQLEGIEEVGDTTTPEEDGEVWIVRRVHDSSEDETSEGSLNESSQVVNSRAKKVGRCGDHNNRMCMHEAADKNQFSEIFRALYLDGTMTPDDLNHPNEDGERPIHYAAELGSESVVGLLISKGGVDVNVQDDDGFTPLMLAANYGHVEVCKILLDAGALVNYQDPLGMTALHCAASMGQTEVVELLLDRGGDPTLEEEQGNRAQHYANNAGHIEIEKILIEAETISSSLQQR